MNQTANKVKHTAVESTLRAYCVEEGKARKRFEANPTEENKKKMQDAVKQHEDYKNFYLYEVDDILHDVGITEV